MNWMRDQSWAFVGVLIAVIALIGAENDVPAIIIIGIAIVIVIVFALILMFADRKRKKVVSEHIEHDRKVFADSENIMKEENLRDLFDQLATDYSYRIEQLRKPNEFVSFFRSVGNRYISTELQSKVENLIVSLVELDEFLVYSFFVYPEHQPIGNVRLCLQPDVDPDRDGSGLPEEIEFFKSKIHDLERVLSETRDRYKEYRLKIKEELYV